MIRADLKPCPHCGGYVNYIYNAVELYPTGIQCVKCHMIVRYSRIKPPRQHEPYERVFKELAEAWNRRDA